MGRTLEVKQSKPEKSRFHFTVADSCAELRSLEKLLFAGNSRSAAGLLLAQIRLLFARAQVGVAIHRGDLLSLLQVACRVGNRGRP